MGCSNLPTDEEKIKIGLIAPLTGEKQKLGEDLKTGAELFQRLHEDVELIIQDDKSLTPDAISAYRVLRDFNDVSIIIGPFGPTPTASIYGAMTEEDRKKSVVLGITFCTEDFSNFSNTLCSYPSLLDQGREQVTVAQQQGAKTLYYVTENSVLGQVMLGYIEDATQEQGMELIGTEMIDTVQEKTFYTYATKVIASDADAVVAGFSDTKIVSLFQNAFPDMHTNHFLTQFGKLHQPFMLQAVE